MSVEMLQIITLTFFVMSGALFVVAICLFFAFNIPGIVGNLSGMTAKKAIEDIKTKNKEGGKEHASYSHLMKDKRTEKIASSVRLGRQTSRIRNGKTTGKLNKVWEKTAPLGKKKLGETVRLDVVNTAEMRETTILSTKVDEIVLIQLTGELPVFTVDVDIVLCESTEAIE